MDLIWYELIWFDLYLSYVVTCYHWLLWVSTYFNLFHAISTCPGPEGSPGTEMRSKMSTKISFFLFLESFWVGPTCGKCAWFVHMAITWLNSWLLRLDLMEPAREAVLWRHMLKEEKPLVKAHEGFCLTQCTEYTSLSHFETKSSRGTSPISTYIYGSICTSGLEPKLEVTILQELHRHKLGPRQDDELHCLALSEDSIEASWDQSL